MVRARKNWPCAIWFRSLMSSSQLSLNAPSPDSLRTPAIVWPVLRAKNNIIATQNEPQRVLQQPLKRKGEEYRGHSPAVHALRSLLTGDLQEPQRIA